ncbi:MAG: class I SAM-dependent methyltransferase [Emcibacteraceae bacterium]|nr:class I SAM-dependent methyltransferase [Emcibacteraceae bacterium]
MVDNTEPDIITKYEKDTWTRCAESYEETFAGITNEAVSELIQLGNIGPDCHVLEIGSGPGNLANLLTRLGAEVKGIDFSEKMIAVANQHYPDITFKEANAEEVPFVDSVFDCVVANFVVHHLARPEVVFKEIKRVLKPGGKFVFAVWGPPEEQSSIGAFFGAVMAHYELSELPHGPLFGITEKSVFDTLFTGAGLTNCALSIHELQWKMDNLDPLINGFWDWGNMDALPEDTQANIKVTTTENSEPYKQGDGYAFPHAILFGSAVSG